ncbi:MAG: hypothetical protein O3A37_00555 [Planctomycetota bacterium]|nr:hypothetical protein [Planctomycetota bacterium]
MTHLAFFIAVVAASLLWSAAMTAAAVRVHSPWLHRLLIALALVAPTLALLPWLAGSFMLAFAAKLQVNWFGPVLTAFLAATIGGGWIVWAGLRPTTDGPALPPATRWPLVGLMAAFLLAKVVAGGTLLTLDSGITARAAGMKAEAVDLIQANLPPVVADITNAASLYQPAFAALEADPLLNEPDSLLAKAATIDVQDTAVAPLLARHRETLALVRQAAGRDVCRFTRDWTRPSLDLVLPEIQAMRQAARLMQLAARQRAASGDMTGALDDVTRLHRMGQHAAAEPILISGIVGVAIDTMALDTLAQVLPDIGPSNQDLLDADTIRDLIHVVPSFKRHFFGEEAFGTMLLASLCDGGSANDSLDLLASVASSGPTPGLWRSPLRPLIGTFFRVFLLPEDFGAYRSTLRAYQQLLAQPKSFPEITREAQTIEDAVSTDRRGIVTSLLAPALSSCIRSSVRSQALHRAAAVAVAATRHRIAKGSLPESLDDIGPEFLPLEPADPFAANAPLRLKQTDTGLVIYSVGPDGEDDGGPAAPGTEPAAGNDDVGLRLRRP